MKAPASWLRELVDVPVDTATLARDMHMAGFEVASVEDDVIDFEITANRPDCLSLIGLAREIATRYGTALRAPATSSLGGASGTTLGPLTVVVEDSDRCPRYTAAIADVTIGPSPAWLAERLTAIPDRMNPWRWRGIAEGDGFVDIVPIDLGVFQPGNPADKVRDDLAAGWYPGGCRDPGANESSVGTAIRVQREGEPNIGVNHRVRLSRPARGGTGRRGCSASFGNATDPPSSRSRRGGAGACRSRR